MSKSLNARALAAQLLTPVLEGQASLADQLSTATLAQAGQDAALIREFCFGLCRWQPRLQLIADRLLSKKLKAKDKDIETLILLGLYQLEYTRVPPHAALSATVEAAQHIGKDWAKGLINAILRRFQREGTTLCAELQDDPLFRYAHPTWLLKRLQQAWPQQWQTICNANNTRAPMSLRVNARFQSRDDYLQLLDQAGIAAQPGAHSAQAIVLTEPMAAEALPGFAQGWVSVQDEAAQLAAGILQLAPGQRVLDACAAPGGKTCHMLEREPGLAQLLALDADASRAARIEANLQRLQLPAQVVVGDALTPQSWWDGERFDRMLVDAPCSATGVIRRHPDIKLLRRDTDIVKLADQQNRILQALWPLLRPGGLLLYVTCSVLPQENEELLSRFLAAQTDARPEPIAADCGIKQRLGLQLLPEPSGDGYDGFYYALMRKADL